MQHLIITFVLAIALALLPIPGTAFATSGGTDSNGCHNSSSEGYHCHGSSSGGSSSGGSGGSADIGIILGVVVAAAVIGGAILWGLHESGVQVAAGPSDLSENDALVVAEPWLQDAAAGILLRW
jgi:hypothetical protein